MTLTDWLDEYRGLPPDVERIATPPEDDWAEPELLASADRVRNTTPRWRERAARIGYGRPTQV